MEQIEMLSWAAATAASAGTFGITAAGVRYLWRLASDETARHTREVQARVLMADAQYRHPLPIAHYAPSIHYRNHHQSDTSAVDIPETRASIPGTVDLADLHFKPQPGSLLLGIGTTNEPITVSGQQLMHVALAGATGSGKTNTARMLIAQLIAIGSQVVIANPHHTSYDAESGDDWRAIESRLHLAPAVKADQIADLLHWLTYDELPRRIEQRQAGKIPGKPLTLFIDELPVLVNEVEHATDMLSKLLRQGRALRMYLCGASQDFLTKTLGTGSGIREAYRTAYYGGGDLVGARSLLDLKQGDIEEAKLGQGVVYLRSVATTPARIVRVPLATNRGIQKLLTDDHPTVEIKPDSSQDEATQQSAYHAPQSDTTLTPEQQRALSLFLSGKSPADIVYELRGIRSNQGGRYQTALAEILDILRSSVDTQSKAIGQ